jgi:hypothetical protein
MAYAIGSNQKIEPEKIKAGLESVRGLAGKLEAIDAGRILLLSSIILSSRKRWKSSIKPWPLFHTDASSMSWFGWWWSRPFAPAAFRGIGGASSGNSNYHQ